MMTSAVVRGDPVAAASAASLQHTTDGKPGIHRRSRNRYVRASGNLVRDAGTLRRIRALAIPPAWTDVWISPDPSDHVQATGRDARGRKQYRYHPKFREVRDAAKYTRLVELIAVLPKVPIVRRCQELPGQRLFQYLDGDDVKPVTSTDVNDYLREATGGPFTAKDYRTWAATLATALLLCRREHPGSERACKRAINEVLAIVAERLGHTVAICRKSYVHPRLFEDFTNGKLRALARGIRAKGESIDVDALRAIEPAVARYLRSRRTSR